jgi:hypothetical protein
MFSIGVLLVVAGCSFGLGRVATPSLVPTDVGRQVVDQCDADQNGVVSREESKALPALAAAFVHYDKDGDGGVTTDEIAARLQAMLDSRVGRMPCMCKIDLDGKPLSGAIVDFLPEACFDGALQPGRGTTNDKGIAKPVTLDAPPGLPGVQFGLYRVSVTHPRIDLPSRYNTETTLGFELSPLERESDTAEFHLRSK